MNIMILNHSANINDLTHPTTNLTVTMLIIFLFCKNKIIIFKSIDSKNNERNFELSLGFALICRNFEKAYARKSCNS